MSKSALLYRVYILRTNAAIFIQKHIRGYFVRKDLFFISHPRISLLVKWPFPAISVYMAGNFSNPPWKILIPLSYSKHCQIFFSAYFIENPLTPGKYHIKFIVDGEWMFNSLMLISEDNYGNFNNIIVIPNLLSKNFTSNENLLISLKNPIGPNFTFGTYMAGHPKTRFAPLSVENTADSLFIDENLQIFGLADGVGEWINYGLDPGLYSKELLKNFKIEFLNSCQNLENLNRNQIPDMLKKCLKSAFNNTKKCYGSSTILIGFLYNSTLYMLNLGDSSLIILRPNNKTKLLTQVFRSSDLQHYFNCPFQLGYFPDESKYQDLINKGFKGFVDIVEKSNENIENRLYDWPEDAKVEEFDIENEDVVVIGTDGLFDNVYCEDIIKIVLMIKKFSLAPKDYCVRVAKELVMMAIQKGWDTEYWSPFARNAEKAGMNHRGGKLDDTSVIVALALK
ncbi:hypothetical protein SteCoe_31815 [Stentor coeruleus]|uniref:Protein phosphatase n=1 Tax=Stentor coeruleus TaxID=5963 RepID=A0A1R2B0G2_9CILI|nr:hypothetical protein SteCoe_31815 [Stentor coeruleus]